MKLLGVVQKLGQCTTPVRETTLQERLEDPKSGPIKAHEVPNVNFWNKKDYTSSGGISALDAKPTHAAQYLEDENGTVISRERVKMICAHARRFWITLYCDGEAPAMWSSASHKTLAAFSEHMNEYVEFRLCAGGWKALALAYGRYSNWLRKYKKRFPNIKQKFWGMDWDTIAGLETISPDDDDDDDVDDFENIEKFDEYLEPPKKKVKLSPPEATTSKPAPRFTAAQKGKAPIVKVRDTHLACNTTDLLQSQAKNPL